MHRSRCSSRVSHAMSQCRTACWFHSTVLARAVAGTKSHLSLGLLVWWLHAFSRFFIGDSRRAASLRSAILVCCRRRLHTQQCLYIYTCERSTALKETFHSEATSGMSWKLELREGNNKPMGCRRVGVRSCIMTLRDNHRSD